MREVGERVCARSSARLVSRGRRFHSGDCVRRFRQGQVRTRHLQVLSPAASPHQSAQETEAEQ